MLETISPKSVKVKINEIRIMNKISQKELAIKMNVSFKTISHWENGYSEPNLNQLIELKNILNTTFDDLLE